MSVKAPTPEIIAAVKGAVEWFRSVAIYGMRFEEFTGADSRDDKRVVVDPDAELLWARFYEIGSNR